MRVLNIQSHSLISTHTVNCIMQVIKHMVRGGFPFLPSCNVFFTKTQVIKIIICCGKKIYPVPILIFRERYTLLVTSSKAQVLYLVYAHVYIDKIDRLTYSAR